MSILRPRRTNTLFAHVAKKFRERAHQWRSSLVHPPGSAMASQGHTLLSYEECAEGAQANVSRHARVLRDVCPRHRVVPDRERRVF